MAVQLGINRVLSRRAPQGPGQCPEQPVRQRRRNRVRGKGPEILADADEAWVVVPAAEVPICSK